MRTEFQILAAHCDGDTEHGASRSTNPGRVISSHKDYYPKRLSEVKLGVKQSLNDLGGLLHDRLRDGEPERLRRLHRMYARRQFRLGRPKALASETGEA